MTIWLIERKIAIARNLWEAISDLIAQYIKVDNRVMAFFLSMIHIGWKKRNSDWNTIGIENPSKKIRQNIRPTL